jgi:hypothetical protein
MRTEKQRCKETKKRGNMKTKKREIQEQGNKETKKHSNEEKEKDRVCMFYTLTKQKYILN